MMIIIILMKIIIIIIINIIDYIDNNNNTNNNSNENNKTYNDMIYNDNLIKIVMKVIKIMAIIIIRFLFRFNICLLHIQLRNIPFYLNVFQFIQSSILF